MSNPMKDYVDNFRANLPSGVTFESVTARYFFNGKRFISEWDVERYRKYIIKFGYTDAADADVTNYISRVEAADGAALEQTAKDAVDTLVSDLKTAGVWAKRNLIFLPAGPRTLAGAEEQLKGSAVPNFTNYPSGLYSRSSGLSGNGTSAFMDTNYLINTDANLDSSYSILVTEILGAATEPLLSNDPNEGVPESSDNKILVRRDLVRAQTGETTSITFGTAEPTYICVARDNSSTAEVTIQGSTQTINEVAQSQDANDTLIVHKQHQVNAFGESRISYVSAGGFLTQAERADERAAIEAYMTAISGLTDITAIVFPNLGTLVDGETIASAMSADYDQASNYTSSGGTIDTVVASATVNGSPALFTDTVSFNDVVSVSVVVTDSASNERDFNAGTRTVQGIAPTSVEFIATPYDGSNAQEFSIVGSTVNVAYSDHPNDAVIDLPNRRIGFALTVPESNTELTIAIDDVPEYGRPEDITNRPADTYFLVWRQGSQHGDDWNALGQGVVVGSERLHTGTFPAGTIYFQTDPATSATYCAGRVDDWIADTLTRPPASAGTGYLIDTFPAFNWDGQEVPALDMRGFVLGTGDLQMVLTGCVHPDEAPSFWAMESALDWILSSDPEAISFRENWTVTVYPECNMRGLWAARTRVGSDNVDFNRDWPTSTEPVKASLKSAFAADLSVVHATVDFHGGGSNTSQQVVWRYNVESDDAAISAFDSEMSSTFPGNYDSVDWPASIKDQTIQKAIFDGRAATSALHVTSEGREHKDLGVAGWRLQGPAIIQAINAIQPTIWPNWSISAGDGEATVETYPTQPVTPAWSVTANDGGATITSYPGE